MMEHLPDTLAWIVPLIVAAAIARAIHRQSFSLPAPVSLYIVLAMLYLLMNTVSTAILRSLPVWQLFPVTGLIVAWVVVPLHRAFQAGLNWLFRRELESHKHILQQFSHRLSQTRTLAELLEHIACAVEQTVQPSGLAVVLRRGSSLVTESCSGLALTAGTRYSLTGPLPTWLTTHCRPLYLPLETEWLSSLDETERSAIEETEIDLYIPLFSNEQLSGWLALGPRRAMRAYSPDDIAFLVTLSDQASVALEVTRLVYELSQRVDQLSVLNETSRVLGSSLRTEELLEKIHQQVSRLMDASNLYVALYEPETDLVSFPLALENDQCQQWESRRAGRGLTEYIIRTLQSVLIKRNYNQHIDQLGVEALGLPARSWLGVPMVANEQAVGVIAVQNFEHEEAYTEDDLEILSTIASQAAVSIANARLYEQTDQALARRVQELSIRNQNLSEILWLGNVLKADLELKQILQQVVQAISVSLGFNVAIANLAYDTPRPHLRRVAAVGIPPENWRHMRAVEISQDLLSQLMREDFRLGQSYFVNPKAVGSQLLPRQQEQLSSDALARHVKELTFHHPDQDRQAEEGEWCPGDALLVPLTDTSGRLQGVLSVEEPLNGRIPARETIEVLEVFANQASIAIENSRLFKRLAESRDRLQAVLDSTREGMMMLDFTGRIVFANAMFGELFNTSPSSLTGRNLLEVVAKHVRSLNETQAVMMDVIYETLNELARQSEDVHKSDLAVGHRSRFIERVSVPVFDGSGVAIGRLLTLRDITEEKKAEALREDLTSMMVHDLRSPLTTILGGLQVLEFNLTNENDLRAVQVALAGGNRMLNMIEALLDINKMEVGQMPLRRQQSSWPRLVNEAMERMAPLAAEEEVTLQTQLASDLPVIDVDENLLGRVLTNLLDNAIKYSPHGATINLSVTLTENAGGTLETLCRVTDTGPGISPEHHEKIFYKFFQIPNSGARRKGTGLGLAFCRLVVEAHGGRIWVESTPEQGSMFAFTLPVSG